MNALVGILRWGLVLMLAGSGCARLSNPPRPAPPMPPKVDEFGDSIAAGNIPDAGNQDKVSGRDFRMKLAPSAMLAPTPSEHQTLAETAIEPPRLRLQLDPSRIRDMQLHEIEELRSEEEADIHPRNGFVRWLDGFHERLYCRMDNAVRRVDTLWLTEEVRPYDYELSTFKLKLLMRAGGRSNEDSTDYKVKFRADIAIPGLKRRLHLFLDDADRDALPGQDPMELSDDTRVGARVSRTLRHSDLDFGGGVRMHSGVPVGFGELNWRWKWDKTLGGILGLTPRGYWYSDEGFGQTTTLTWTRLFGEKVAIQFRTAEHSTEETNGWEFEQTVRFALLRSGRTRGWVAQASTFPHYKDSDLFWDNSLLSLTLRRALYRKWIYYTLTPQVEFPVEDDYHAKPSFRIGLEILMGGKIGDLI
jgi:hypothetical protein